MEGSRLFVWAGVVFHGLSKCALSRWLRVEVADERCTVFQTRAGSQSPMATSERAAHEPLEFSTVKW